MTDSSPKRKQRLKPIDLFNILKFLVKSKDPIQLQIDYDGSGENGFKMAVTKFNISNIEKVRNLIGQS